MTGEEVFDTVVVGSGFGGAMTARQLIRAGHRVLMVERGRWVPRGAFNWAPEGTVDLTPHYSLSTPYRLAGSDETVGLYSCVGGPSVFFGGVSLRFRVEDFRPPVEIVGDSGARWPLDYDELEPYYTEAERILDVAGAAGEDPVEPPRSAPYPQRAPPLSQASRTLAAAARRLGLSPFPLPLAINYRRPEETGRKACIQCTTCDTFACAVEAKNDLATVVLPDLLDRGMELRAGTVAVRLEAERNGGDKPDGRRISALHCVEEETGRRRTYRARRFVVAAGALGSPHLLLASDLARHNPAGHAVGRYLMRHRNAIVFGVFPHAPDPAGEFHKQVGIHDYYFGGDDRAGRGRAGGNGSGKLGAIQQVQTPPVELVRRHIPDLLGYLMSPRVDYLGGLLVIAEDQPRARNRIEVDLRRADRFGLPRASIAHRYTPRDRAAGKTLARASRKILREAGALLFYSHEIRTFSHAVGTVRMGPDPSSSPLDEACRFRGLENLWVVDGSVFPTSAGLNPSLTIAALALRAGERIAREGTP